MPGELAHYIYQYGYLAIFLLVFLQEVGAPNPIPNEFLLVFSGYLVFTGTLNVFAVIASAFAGDLIAGTIVYSVFYKFSQRMIRSKWRWLSRFIRKLQVRCKPFSQQNLTGIFIGRLSPFIRGYVAVACGLICLHPSRFASVTLITTSIWSSFYVICGYFLAPYWLYMNDHIISFKYLLFGILIFFVTLPIVRNLFRKKRNRQTPSE